MKARGEGDALLLPTGELDGIVVYAVGQAYGLEKSTGTGEAICGAGSLGIELVGEEHVFKSGERSDELVGLEDKADGSAAKLCQLVLGQVGDRLAGEVDVAGGGCVETGEKAEECGFAAAGGSHDGGKLSGRDGEGRCL